MTDPTAVNITPIGPVLLLLPKPAPPPSSGPIQLADVEPTLETCGMVVAVGASFRCESCDALREPTVAVGEWVLFGRNAGGEVTLDGTTYLVVQESEILAVIDPTAVVEMA